MSFLGIDFGKKRIGLALSEGTLAQPYKIISAKSWIDELGKILKEEKVETIIIGISEGEMAEETRKFISVLKRMVGTEIIEWDETLTTQEAIQKMITSGKSQKFRKEKNDAIAASIILQSYLDNNVIAIPTLRREKQSRG